jgi:hypothetical protein
VPGVTKLRLWAFIGLLVLGAGCAVVPLTPAVTGRMLNGWAVVSKDGAGVSSLAGSSSSSFCEGLRRTWATPEGTPYPIRCEYVRFDLNPQSPNFHVAVGTEPTSGVPLFIGGPTQEDCDLLRRRYSERKSLVQTQYSWSEIPCRPTTLMER